jgi:hypothetical protein
MRVIAMGVVAVALLFVLVAGASLRWGVDSRELSRCRDELTEYVRLWW